MDNFNLSIILPFYKKLDEFKKVLPINLKYFQRNGIEIIIVLDEPSHQNELLNILKCYPFINWKVIVNENIHEWRNPSKALNVGIKHAVKEYIMIMSPESEFYNDAIMLLRNAVKTYEKCFAIGKVAFEYFDTEINEDNIDKINYFPYGSIMVKKEYLMAIKGYDEEYLEWGGDDDNLRARLQFYGIRKIFLNNAVLIHREESYSEINRTDFDKSRNKNRRSEAIVHLRKSIQDKKEIYYPSSYIGNKYNWGLDFQKIIFDWQCNKFAFELCSKYLSKFKEYEIKESNIFSREYRLVALVQAFNESKTINNFLNHISKYCDGIILLDDGSNDKTYSISNNEKLLIKLNKKRVGFNDLENRNILLNAASFIRSEWFYFIDVDERFDDRYSDIYSIINLDINSVAFNFIHLWDSEQEYRTDYPYSKNGIQPHWRMYRNIGRMQISSTKKLHFDAIPYIGNRCYSKILIKHYGLLSREKRVQKYNFYKNIDKQNDQVSYEHLIDNSVKTDLVKNLNL